jgi:hypothetical protein
MALVVKITCEICHKEKQVTCGAGGPAPSICNECAEEYAMEIYEKRRKAYSDKVIELHDRSSTQAVLVFLAEEIFDLKNKQDTPAVSDLTF